MKIYGLIGFPLVQSFSKQYFTDKFCREAITDCLFELYPIESISQFPGLIESHPKIKGLAVTIPYKKAVMPFLTRIHETARLTGAVNCITIHDDILIGYNTDCIGFEQSLLPLLQPHYTGALVLGTGGAAAAVIYVLDKLGIKYLRISRTPDAEQNVLEYDNIDADLLYAYPLVVNCTPLGMVPDENSFPRLPYEYLNSRNLVYDLVYKPEKTILLQRAEANGAAIKNGMEMLLIQAEENWRIWRMDQFNTDL
jgi:shikimate dehydrogenase